METNNGDHNTQSDPGSWIKILPGVMRWVGASALLFSLYNFLLNGWSGSSDVVRYLMLLVHTGALAAIALISGNYLKEGKGPRLLMMMALISVPVNFTIIGAFLVYTSGSFTIPLLPGAMTWRVDSLAVALTVLLSALVVLIPVVILSFRTLARGMSLRMSMLFLASCSALLIPMRDPLLIAIVIFVLTLVTVLITACTARQKTEVKTREGLFALLIQFLPVLILAVRNLWLYAPEMFVGSAVCFVLFIVVRQCSTYLDKPSSLHIPLDLLGAGFALLTGWSVMEALLGAGASPSFGYLSSSLLVAGMYYELSCRAVVMQGLYRGFSAAALIAGLLGNMLLLGGVLASIAPIFVGLILLCYSYFIQQKAMFISGVILLLAGGVNQLSFALRWFDFGYWASLTVLGVISILLGSILEARGPEIKSWLKESKSRYLAWDF